MDETAEDLDFLRLSEKWIRIVNKIDANEKSPRDFGTGDLLHCSEIHTVMAIGKNPSANITSLSENLGISKSAISQMVKKLEKKDLVERWHDEGNRKDIRLLLTPRGKIAYLGHAQHHAKIYAGMYRRLGSLKNSEFDLISHFLSAVEETFDECDEGIAP